MRIVLHIGANKTGTTAIQQYFHNNRKLLSRHGILWPKTGARGHAHYDLSHWLGFSHSSQNALGPHELDQVRAALLNEVEQTLPSVVVISSEMFMLRRSIERAQYFFSGLDVEVYAMLRRHDEWWPSLWSQAIRTVEQPKWGRDFESFLGFQRTKQSQHTSYRSLLEAWDNAFPHRVRAIPFESHLMPNGVLPLFLKAIGISSIQNILPDTEILANASPRIDALSLIDFLQRSEVIEHRRRNDIIAKTLNDGGSGLKIDKFLSGNLKLSLIEENLEDYCFLQKYFSTLTNSSHFFSAPLPEDRGQNGPHFLPAISAIELLVNEIF